MDARVSKAAEYVRGFGVTEDDITRKMTEFGMQKIAPIVDRLEDTQKANTGLLRELNSSQAQNRDLIHSIVVKESKK